MNFEPLNNLNFSMKRYLFICTLLFSYSLVFAQTDQGLIAHYSFDGCNLDDETGTEANRGLANVNGVPPICECGVIGKSLRFDELTNPAHVNDITFAGPVNDEFDTEDFTMSFYFKPTNVQGTMDIISKRDKDDCTNFHAFAVKFTAGSNTLNVLLSEDNDVNASLLYQLPFGRCWYHITIVRKGAASQLYVDGEFVQEVKASRRVDISNNDFLKISGSPCQGTFELPFQGNIDELRIYNQALDKDEIAGLFVPYNRLVNEPNPKIFLGNSLEIEPSLTCAHSFLWTPSDGLNQADTLTPTITPIEPGVITYQIQYIDSTCIATDTIQVTVIDPSTLDCNEIFLPKAFTPNGHGPLQNETYGISNPEAMEQLISFEIFDRWGTMVFGTSDRFTKWDGNFKGQAINPGVFLYKVVYQCDGEEQIQAGSLTLIR